MIEESIFIVKAPKNDQALFSILIPSWNNLPYLQLCVESIRKNSYFSHQIIIHVNEGSDGTLDWIRQQPDIDYSVSPENIGVCYALNISASLATTDYILFINDDMYVCPNWDKALYDTILEIGHNRFFISATTIEATAETSCSILQDFGRDINTFNEEKLLKEFATLPIGDWQGSTWPPNIVHKEVWDLVGGYSVEFSPGMYSDPDFSMKLWQVGIRLFKGVSTSRVYHFGSISVNRIKKNDGYYAFVNKWKMTSGTMSKYYLRRGQPFDGPLREPELPLAVKAKTLYRRLLSVFH